MMLPKSFFYFSPVFFFFQGQMRQIIEKWEDINFFGFLLRVCCSDFAVNTINMAGNRE